MILFAVVLLSYGYIAAYLNVRLYNPYIDSLLFLSLSLGVVSVLTFFVCDSVFFKWLYLTILWVIVSGVLLVMTPQYPGGWAFSSPGRESVSIWLSVLFVIISLAKLVGDTKKLRQGGEK